MRARTLAQMSPYPIPFHPPGSRGQGGSSSESEDTGADDKWICVRFIQKRGIERTPTALEQYCWGLGRTKGKLKVSQVRAKVQHAEVRGKSCL